MRTLCAARRPSQALLLNRQSPLPHGPAVSAPSSVRHLHLWGLSRQLTTSSALPLRCRSELAYPRRYSIVRRVVAWHSAFLNQLGIFARSSQPCSSLTRGASAPIIGIDLGTTYRFGLALCSASITFSPISCVAVAEAGGAEPKILENSEGQRTTPSV